MDPLRKNSFYQTLQLFNTSSAHLNALLKQALHMDTNSAHPILSKNYVADQLAVVTPIRHGFTKLPSTTKALRKTAQHHDHVCFTTLSALRGFMYTSFVNSWLCIPSASPSHNF
jgi:hypothetical protein